MPNDLIATDPLVAHNFFLEIDGKIVTTLSGVSGIDLEIEVASITQTGPDGKMQIVKTVGNQAKAGDLSITRMSPVDSTKDELWKWFNDVRDKGMAVAARTGKRKNGSIVIYDSSNTEVSRFNFYNGWPSKISVDAFSSDSNDAVKETITITCERLERVK